MRIFDVNVLVLAHRADLEGHVTTASFVAEATAQGRPFCIPPVVASGAVRVSTHPRIFDEPTPLRDILNFVNALRDRPSHVLLDESTAWPVFTRLCGASDARGNRIPDAYLAALALANGASLVTADRGLARYQGLRLEHPMETSAAS